MVQIIWHFFEFFKKGFPFLDKNGCKILCFFKDATIYAMKFCPVRKRRQKNYGRWFQPSALWSILNMSEKFIPKLIKTLINQSYKMQQDTWNTRLEASYTSLWGLPIVSYSQSVQLSSYIHQDKIESYLMCVRTNEICAWNILMLSLSCIGP